LLTPLEEFKQITYMKITKLNNKNEVVMKFRPLYDRIAIKPIEQEEKTAGGIIIPDTAKEKPMQGEVVAVGKGIKDDKGTIHPLEIKVGDKVLYGKWAGTEVRVDGHDLIVMKESDVMGIIG
jgi:chaperonin GroES